MIRDVRLLLRCRAAADLNSALNLGRASEHRTGYESPGIPWLPVAMPA